MNNLRMFIVSSIMAVIFCSAVTAGVSVSSLVGDKDGFGIPGMDPVPADGTSMSTSGPRRDVGDPVFMDDWGFEQQGGAFGSPIVYSHDFVSLPESFASASLTIQHAGMGDERGPWDVAVNGVSVGKIGVDNGGLTTVLEVFDIPLSAVTIGKANTVTLTYEDTQNEGYAINFSELTVVVPEPLTGGMLVVGGLCLLGRRKSC